MPIQTFFNGNSSEPSNTYNDLPVIDKWALTSPKDYRASKELVAAVNVALTLGMPLLLTGEPGCGKSELARRLAWELGFPGSERGDQVLKYVIKSTTEARDLFYNFDVVGRFHAAQSGKASDARDFIEYQALGLAIMRAKGRNGEFPEGLLSDSEREKLPEQAHRSVVLIDEIDKAPRDVPNDILSELEHLEFFIPELGGKKIGLDAKDSEHKPIVIITSNSERDLPPAFLRRCVYFHVPFPPFASENSEGVTIEEIVTTRLGKRFVDGDPLLADALSLCQFLRADSVSLYKPPSLAELLSWVSLVALMKENQVILDGRPIKNLMDIHADSLISGMKTTLLKTREDQDRAEALLQDWLRNKQVEG